MKTVQIPESTFFLLCEFFGLTDQEQLSDDDRIDLGLRIRADLQDKLDAVKRRDAYSRYKAGSEQGRQDYLDAAGIMPDYRWSAAYDKARNEG